MRFKTLMPTLFVASLLYAGCSQTTPVKPNETNGDLAPTAKTESALSLPAQAQSGLPLLTPMKIKNNMQLAPSTAKQFTFAVLGDSQGDTTATQIATRVFEAIRDYKPAKPAFAFCLGDIVKGKDPNDPTGTIKEKYIQYLTMAETAGVPVFNAPGNHEMDDRDDVPSERMHQLYRDNVAPTYGAFNYGNARFIALNTEDVPCQNLPSTNPPCKTVPTPPPGMEFSYIGDTQLQQLDQDLAANKDKTHIFIMMHYPVKPYSSSNALNPDSLKKLTDILAKYKNISYVLASHEHQFYNPQDKKNFTTVAPYKAGEPRRYLVSGGAGAKIFVNPQNGGFNHYLIFEVNGDDVFVKINRIDS